MHLGRLLVAVGNPTITCVLDSRMVEGNHTIASSFNDEDAHFLEVSNLSTPEGLIDLDIEGPVGTLLLTPPPEEGVSSCVREWIDEVAPQKIVYHNMSFQSATDDIRNLAKSKRDGVSYRVIELKGFDTNPHTMECSIVLLMQREVDEAEAKAAEERRKRSSDSSRDYLGIDEDEEEIHWNSDDDLDVDKLVAQYSGGVQGGKDGIYDHTEEEEEQEEAHKEEEWKLPVQDIDQPPAITDEQASPTIPVNPPLPGFEEDNEGTSVQKRRKRAEAVEGDPSVHRRNKNKRWKH